MQSFLKQPVQHSSGVNAQGLASAQLMERTPACNMLIVNVMGINTPKSQTGEAVHSPAAVTCQACPPR